MRTTNVFDKKRKQNKNPTEKNKAAKFAEYIVLCCFFGGLVIGRFAAAMLSPESAQAAQELLFGYLTTETGSSFGEIFVSGMSGNFFMLLVLIFCSYCAIGIPIIFLLIICQGAGIGLSFSTIFALFGTKALPYVILVLLPGTIINVVVMTTAAKGAVLQSRMVFRRVFLSQGVTLAPFSGESTAVKYFIFTVILALSAFYYTMLCLHFPPLSV